MLYLLYFIFLINGEIEFRKDIKQTLMKKILMLCADKVLKLPD